MWNEADLLQAVEVRVKKKRFLHIQGVITMADKLAVRWQADTVKARIAAVLHDYAKYENDQALLAYAKESAYTTNQAEEGNPQLLHGPVGAYLVQKHLGVDDPEILSAIAYHNFGKAKMSLLDKIIYLADAIEPGRAYPGVEDLREWAFEDLDKAVLASVRQTIQFVLDKEEYLHPGSVAMWNDMIQEVKGR